MRRFKSFVGLDYKEDKILSGFARMEIPHNLITEEQLHKINFRTLALSSDRLKIHERWKSALAKGKSMALVPEIQVQNKTLPRMFVMYNTIEAMLKSSLYFFFSAFSFLIGNIPSQFTNNFYPFFIFISLAIFIIFLITLPSIFKAIWLFLKHGSPTGSMREVARVVIMSMCEFKIIKTDISLLNIVIEKSPQGYTYCGLDGGTPYEKSIFLDALDQIFSSINNPRYLIRRKSINFLLTQIDYHQVPELLARQKYQAEFFTKMWNKYIGYSELIYTRSSEGRKILLKARKTSFSSNFTRNADRLSSWK